MKDKQLKKSYQSNDEMAQDLAEYISKTEGIISLYYRLHQKNDNFYKSLENQQAKALIKKTIKSELGNFVTKSLIEKTLYFLEIEQLVASDLVNPDTRFPLKNGELVFKDNGEIKLEKAESYFTFQSNLSFTTATDTQPASIFLQQVLPTEDDRRLFLEILAMAMFPCLRKIINFDVVLICYGTGANGKSVLLNTMIPRIFGRDCIANVTLETFGERFALAGLLGKRLNIATENNVSHISENARLKALTSGDQQTVERKHKDPFSAVLNAIPIFAINKKPTIGDVSYAMERRLYITHFSNRFVDEPKNEGEFKAKAELKDDPQCEESLKIQSGLLNLIVDTAKDIFKNKKISPNNKSIIHAAQENGSHHRRFISETFEFNPRGVTLSEEIFEEYCQWCQLEGILDGKINNSSAWTHPENYDKATKTKDRLTKRLKEIYPEKIFTEKTAKGRGLRGIQKKSNLVVPPAIPSANAYTTGSTAMATKNYARLFGAQNDNRTTDRRANGEKENEEIPYTTSPAVNYGDQDEEKQLIIENIDSPIQEGNRAGEAAILNSFDGDEFVF